MRRNIAAIVAMMLIIAYGVWYVDIKNGLEEETAWTQTKSTTTVTATTVTTYPTTTTTTLSLTTTTIPPSTTTSTQRGEQIALENAFSVTMMDAYPSVMTQERWVELGRRTCTQMTHYKDEGLSNDEYLLVMIELALGDDELALMYAGMAGAAAVVLCPELADWSFNG